MEHDNFDAFKLVKNQPWIDRALENIAPQWALKRLEARVQKSLFEYNAARTNRLYAPRAIWSARREHAEPTRPRGDDVGSARPR